jgi:hypothetical protein
MRRKWKRPRHPNKGRGKPPPVSMKRVLVWVRCGEPGGRFRPSKRRPLPKNAAAGPYAVQRKPASTLASRRTPLVTRLKTPKAVPRRLGGAAAATSVVKRPWVAPMCNPQIGLAGETPTRVTALGIEIVPARAHLLWGLCLLIAYFLIGFVLYNRPEWPVLYAVSNDSPAPDDTTTAARRGTL